MSSNWKEPIVWATFIIAFATIVNIGISTLMWVVTKENTEISRKVLEASFRPYVGSPRARAARLKNDALGIEIEIKNFGRIPAYKFEVITWGVMLDGVEPNERKLGPSGTPTLLLPTASNFLQARLGSGFYSKVVSGQTKLEIELEVQYTDATGKYYRYRIKYAYDHTREGFARIEEEEYQPSS